jgi:hypothetical protein
MAGQPNVSVCLSVSPAPGAHGRAAECVGLQPHALQAALAQLVCKKVGKGAAERVAGDEDAERRGALRPRPRRQPTYGLKYTVVDAVAGVALKAWRGCSADCCVIWCTTISPGLLVHMPVWSVGLPIPIDSRDKML